MMGEIIHSFLTILGTFSVVSDGTSLIRVYLPSENLPPMDEGRDCITDMAESEINEFLSGGRMDFDIPFEREGTEFQKAVWDAILHIPYGETRTYSEIAAETGHPNAARAVGTACRRNHVPIIIPCHRVVPSGGGCGGYIGGATMKRRLIAFERETGGIPRIDLG